MKHTKLPKTVHFILILLVPAAVFLIGSLSRYQATYPKFANFQHDTEDNASTLPYTNMDKNIKPSEKKMTRLPNSTRTPPQKTSTTGQRSKLTTHTGQTKEYVINEIKLCAIGGRRAERIDLLIMVPSAANEFVARQAIRHSHASMSKHNTANVRHVFIFGISKDAKLNQKIEDESEKFHDIVLIDMIDTYDNLTLKVISGLNWTATFCSSAKYVIKLDTDTWLNIKKLLSMLSTPALTLHNTVGGTPQHGARPTRDPKNKWYTSVAEFPKDVFPDYCSGPGYIMRTEAAREIVRISKSIPLVRMEDVYIGMCVEALRYSVRNIPGFCWWRPTGDPCKLNSYVTAHKITPNELTAAWNSKCS